MIEIYLVTSIAPIPVATMVNREWGGMGPVSYTHLDVYKRQVKRSLKELEDIGLILRVRRGVGEPNRIYTLLPKGGLP